uniref:Myb/SANT-like DNA-binding domain-containing protein n=1 Tax=Dicentrarchus labrax TaxID=13489 RepID=A0A8P4KIU3_DICLA
MENSDGASQWRESEVLDLISIWGDTSIQAKLEGSYRNQQGHRRTWLQCQRKVKSLKAKFKETNESNNRSGRGRITCPFYNELSRVMGDKPSCQPLELLDSYEAESSSAAGITETTGRSTTATKSSGSKNHHVFIRLLLNH